MRLGISDHRGRFATTLASQQTRLRKGAVALLRLGAGLQAGNMVERERRPTTTVAASSAAPRPPRGNAAAACFDSPGASPNAEGRDDDNASLPGRSTVEQRGNNDVLGLQTAKGATVPSLLL